MIGVAWLAGAIVFEVGGTLSLRMAAHGHKPWWVGVALGYLVAFSLLAAALGTGIPLGVAYGIWTACGVALTAVLSRILFNEPLTWLMGLGIILIAGGVFLIQIGAAH